MSKLGLILGDQLNVDNAVLGALDPSVDRLVMGELWDETHYVPHHFKKTILVLSAMRHRAQELRQSGWQLDYHRLDPSSSIKGFDSLLDSIIGRHEITEVVVAHPGEWRVLNLLQDWSKTRNVCLSVLEDRRFICSLDTFNQWAQGRKQLRMEFFYRIMRQKTGFLMEGGAPVSGVWNLDAENRKRWRGDPPIPAMRSFEPDQITKEVIEQVMNACQGFGEPGGFDYPVTRQEAELALDDFIEHRLSAFGDFQDAMDDEEDYLFHSRLSAALNLGLLDPSTVCRRAIAAWTDGRAPLNAVEGFIRQVIGWREFIRGIYWRFMPSYAEQNTLNHQHPLPAWYWTGKTSMRCLAKAIDATRRNAYAHHIQRLMVTGNFALLLGVVPDEICRWYLAVYADAYDWVELPNTLGMVMHADGGIVGSKPYAASGKYIDRMSNHCKSCHFNVKETHSQLACPFNALYWDFLVRHRDQFEANPRMKMMYRNVDRMDKDQLALTLSRAQWIKDHVDEI